MNRRSLLKLIPAIFAAPLAFVMGKKEPVVDKLSIAHGRRLGFAESDKWHVIHAQPSTATFYLDGKRIKAKSPPQSWFDETDNPFEV